MIRRAIVLAVVRIKVQDILHERTGSRESLRDVGLEQLADVVPAIEVTRSLVQTPMLLVHVERQPY